MIWLFLMKLKEHVFERYQKNDLFLNETKRITNFGKKLKGRPVFERN